MVDWIHVLVRLLLPDVCTGCGVLPRAPSAAMPFCRTCAHGCTRLPQSLAHVGDVTAGWAHHGPLAAAVYRLKYGGDVALAGPLGRMMAILPALVRDPSSGHPWDAIVPVPLHRLRAWRRGYNQAQLLARHAARSATASPPIEPGLLRRVRATAPQAALPRTRRHTNVDRAFHAPCPDAIAGRSILVVDDVTTTGATLRACIDALRAAGAAHVGGLALLRALA